MSCGDVSKDFSTSHERNCRTSGGLNVTSELFVNTTKDLQNTLLCVVRGRDYTPTHELHYVHEVRSE